MYYKVQDNSLPSGFSIHDDMEGTALSLSSWPQYAIEITNQEAESIRLSNILTTPVPQSVTMRQARLALLNAGLLQIVNTTVQNMQGQAGDAARIEWEFSSQVYRSQPLVISLAPVIGMTDNQLDQLFIEAAKL